MSWVLMTAVGVGSMWATTRTSPQFDILLVRLAGFAFIAAGLIGVTGWLGDAIASATTWILDGAEAIGAAALGTTVVWIIAAGVGVMWVLAMLPDQLFRYDAPDWLVIGGILIPSLLANVPGDLGAFLRTITTWAGEAVTTVIGNAVS